mgnify:CR=1 FL=1
MTTRKKTPTNAEIHAELKKLHLSVQVLTELLRKVHEENTHAHTNQPVRKTFNLCGGKQTYWS